MKAIILRTAILTVTVIAVYSVSNAQIFLQEGFESGARPTGWTNEYVSGTELWRYRNGGFNPNDPNNTVPAGDTDIARNPSSAYSGTYNAFFQIQGTNQERTMLVTPPINLEDARKPELSFWLAQMTWTKATSDWDVLRVYYKTAIDKSWVLLSEFLDPVEEWTKIRINLPEPSSTYYIAFEAHNKWGFGVCIDDVIVEEKDVIPRYVSQLSVSHPVLSFVPSGSNNTPILRLDVNITGNTGSPILEEINLKSLNTSDNDIKENGVKLYYTSGQTLNLSTPIGTPASFSSGIAQLSGLNMELPSGMSYIWVTYDVKEEATHGNFLDAMFEAESILLNDTLYPAASQSPSGRRTINKTVYFQDFEGTHNWTLIPEFQVDVPDGTKGGSPGNPNVSNAYSGTKILGTDLTGLGANPGNYEPNLTLASAYTAISPPIDLFFYKNIKLQFQRHLNVDWQDKAAIEASRDAGSNWTNIWENTNLITENMWSTQNYNMPISLERTPDFKLKYRLGPTSPSGNYSGWNIDDVIVTAEFIAKDASITEWISPTSGCGHTATENVIVRVANLGGEDITTEFPVGYSLNGGATWVTANVTEPIPVGESIEFTFPNTINLTSPGLRSSVRARTQLPGDQATGNNLLSTSFYVVPTYTMPFTVNFETNDGYWRTFGANLWQYGSPSGDSIKFASSGMNAWATGLNSYYGSIFLGTEQTIFSDGFETDLGWTFTPEFERGNTEWPKYSYEGSYFIGTDLSGDGVNPYYYENGITPASSSKAVSPAIDVSGYSEISVEFRRNLSILENDHATFEFSPDNGVTWISLWENAGIEVFDNDYTLQSYPIDNEYSNSTQMRFRFAITQTSAEGPVELGWSIDNFSVKGKPVNPTYAYLESPCFNLSNAVKPIFEAKLWVETEPNVDGMTLFYTLDDGATWEQFDSSSDYNDYWNWYNDKPVSALGVDGWSGSSGGWITVKQTLPDEVIGFSSVRFRFAFLCNNHNNDFDGIAIDDIKIYEAPIDLGVTEILNLVSTCELSNEEQITVKVKNFGIKNLLAGDKVGVKLTIDYSGDFNGESSITTEEITLADEFTIGTTMDYTFAKKFDLSAPGSYSFTAYTLGETDPLFYNTASNDSASVSIMVQRPFIDLGPDIYTVIPDTVELVATSQMANITYAWYDHEDMISVISTSDKFMVPTINGGEFWVALENELECVSIDHIKVQRLLADVGVSSFDSPNSSCELFEQTPFNVWVTNYGTDTLLTNSIITLGYQIEALPAVENIDFTLTSDLLPGDSVLVTFIGAETDMRALTTYQRKAWATVVNDYDPSNDLLDKTITVWGYPSFTFTDPNIVDGTITYSGVSYQLDPGEWTAYYWHRDESTERLFTMDTTGMVKVTVYDEHMCPDDDEVYVNLEFTSVGVVEAITPFSACEFLSPVTPKFKIQNLGTSNIPAFTQVFFGYKLNNVLQEELNYTILADIPPNGTFDSYFSTPVDMSTPGTYNFEFYATFAGDPKPEDDALFHVVKVYGYPTIDLGLDVYTRALSHTLDAGDTALEYLWSTGETTQTIEVTEDGDYSVTASSGGDCEDSDMVKVTFLRHDYGITSILSPNTACSEEELKTISVRFANLGNDTLKAETSVTFEYTINEGATVQEAFEFTEDLTPGEHIDFSFAQKVDFSIPGNYTIQAKGIFAGDFNTSNDGTSKSIEIFDLPTVYLGPDTIIRSGLITLDAGPDLTYLWSDASTMQTLDVTETGIYSVEVTNSNGCKASDEISIISITPDYGVVSMSTPISGCSLSNAEIVSVKFKNHGTDTLYEDHTIQLRLYLNGILQSTEQYTILEEFYPGDELAYTFSRKINLSNAGSYTVRAETYHSLDQNSSNDGFNKPVDVWGNPTVTHAAITPGTYCLNNEPITLTGGNPAGGSYSGMGVIGNQFDPSIAGAGINSITYTYVEPVHGCSNTQNLSITVLDLPEISLSAFDPSCDNATPITLTHGTPTDGTYSGIGVTEGIFYPAVVGAGSYTISYSLTDGNGCTNTVSQDMVVNAKPEVTLADIPSVCISVAPYALTGGNPEGGTYSGTGVSGGMFNPANAGVGTHTITYTYTNAEGCTDFATKQITVNPLPIITFNDLGTICIDSSPLELSGATPLNGTYSGIGVADGFFTPSVPGVGNKSIIYTYTDANGCTNSGNANITVVDLPVVEFDPLESICLNAEPILISGGTPSGGIYTGPGVSEGYFNPADAGAGTHPIVYTYTDGNSCVNSATSNIEVFAPTSVTSPALDPICVNGTTLELPDGNPVGGVYTGPGVNSGAFYPSLAGSGVHTIKYSYTDANGCTYSSTENIEVFALTEVTLQAFDPLCINSEAITLTGGSPLSGTYSGTAVTDGIFDPAQTVPGTHTITYTFTDGNGCTNTANAPITVHPLTTVTLEAFSPVCANAEPFTLSGGNPTGGVYRVNGDITTTFDPATLGAGTHEVTYSFTNLSGCSNTATQSIEVYALTSVSLPAFSPVCGNAEPFAITGGAPAGGTYSINGVTLVTFDPQDFAPGVYTVVYSHTDGNGCTNTASSQIEVYAVPDVSLAAFNGICVNADPIALTGGTPAGGAYRVNGVESSTFNPANAGVGNHTITYTFTNANGCSNTASQPIEVFDVPTVTIASISPVCANAEPFALTGGSPAGGSYSINGVDVVEFNPANYTAEVHTVIYNFTNANGCTNSASTSIEVYALTTVTLAAFSPVCGNAEPVAITGGAPAGGTYSINGVTLVTFDPQDFAPGVYTVVYSHTDGNGCTNTASSQIEVYAVPDVSLAAFNGICVNADPIALTGGTPAGGAYRVNGVESSTFNPANAGVGNHTITYTFTNANGCSNTASQPIEVFDVPTVTIASISPVCANAEPFALTGGSPAGGSYSINGVDVVEFNPANYTAEVHTVIYNFTNANGCTNSASTSIEVYALTSVSLAAFSPVCGNADEFELTGGSPAGGTYSGTGVSNGKFNPTVAGPGVHTITYTVTNANGCTTSATANLEVYTTPTVDLGEDRAVAEPFTLDAGSEFVSYLWNDGSTAQTFFVQYPGTYSVEVVDNNGCVGSDEVIITFSTSLISALELLKPETGECESDEFAVTAKFANKRGETVANGQIITLRYQVQGSNAVEESYTLSQDLANNAEFTYTFNQHLNLEAGDRTIQLRADYDQKPGNILSQTITIHPNPVFSLGDDREVTLPYTLEAGITDVTYLWSTGSTEPSIVVDEPGTYSLTVTNPFGCSATDEVVITASWVEEIPGTGTVVSVFPNPANSFISVDIQPQKPANFVVELISPSGQRVYSKSLSKDQPFTHQVDVSGFTPGMYLLRVSSGGQWISVKLVIQR